MSVRGDRSLAVGLIFLLAACGKTEENSDNDSKPDETAHASGGASPGVGGTASGGEASVQLPSYIKASNADAADLFGVSIALSADGLTLAVGANRESSAAQGIDGDQDDNTRTDSGAAYVFSMREGVWQQEAFLKASLVDEGDAFGTSVAISADGSTLAVSAPFESSAATGVDGDETDNSATDSGAVYVFARTGESWVQEAYIKASNTTEDSLFGFSLSLSADGNVLAVGAEGESSSATGVDGDQNDSSASEAGAVYLFSRSGSSWVQTAYLKASNTEARDHFGGSVSLSGDGTTLAVGAYWEDGAAIGENGNQADNSASGAGAVYLFMNDGGSWLQQTYLKPNHSGAIASDSFGSAVSLSTDGNTLAVGAVGDESSVPGIDGTPNGTTLAYSGAAYVFSREAGSWAQLAYIKAQNPGEGDEFGHHISLSGDGETLAVGAALESSSSLGVNGESNDAAPASGATYVFGGEGSSWRQEAFVKATNSNSGDRFGWSAALSADGETLAVGASRESSSATGVDGDLMDDSAARAGAAYVYYELSSY